MKDFGENYALFHSHVKLFISNCPFFLDRIIARSGQMRSIIDILITWKCHLSNNCITQCTCMPGIEDSQIAWLLKRSLLIWIEILSRLESTAFILSTSIYFPSCSSSSLLCLSFLGKMSWQFLLLFFFFSFGVPGHYCLAR